MKMIIPPSLKEGDKISVVATARWISPEHYESAAELFRSWGFGVCRGNHLFEKNFQLAGTDDQRAADLQAAIDDPDTAAIVIGRGGYGTVRILDRVDFSPLLKKPKWICGYSDITALHMKLHALGIASIHSTMPVSFGDATEAALENLRLALRGELREVEFTPDRDAPGQDLAVEGIIAGGNLSVLFSMMGSREMAVQDDFILFIEDVDEMLYHIDRMITGMKRSGFLGRVRAICMGGFTLMKDNTAEFGFKTENPWGADPYETVGAVAAELKVPLFTGIPAGHMADNRAFYLGIPVRIETTGGLSRMLFQHRGWDK